MRSAIPVAAFLASAMPALAGPPFVSDDPETTDQSHYEIYLFNAGTATRDGSGGAYGIDFNYGAGPNLQLTAVLPLEYDHPAGAAHASSLGNIELAVKYRFLRQDSFGWDVAFFPRVLLSSASKRVGDQHVSVLLPLWLQKDIGPWSTFGGGGCTIHRGGDSIDFCLVTWALARQVLPNLQIGAEAFHATPDTHDGHNTSGVNFALRYDMTENLHLLGSIGPGIQNADEINQYSWYLSLLLTF